MSTQTPDRTDPLPRWVLGIVATLVGGLILGGWSSISSDVRAHGSRIAAHEAQIVDAERRATAADARLVRIEDKIDDLDRYLRSPERK